MSKENWGSPGMPPYYVDVLDRQPLGEFSEKVYIRGRHLNLGKPHQGWQGDETIVSRVLREGEMQVIKRMTD